MDLEEPEVIGESGDNWEGKNTTLPCFMWGQEMKVLILQVIPLGPT